MYGVTIVAQLSMRIYGVIKVIPIFFYFLAGVKHEKKK